MLSTCTSRPEKKVQAILFHSVCHRISICNKPGRFELHITFYSSESGASLAYSDFNYNDPRQQGSLASTTEGGATLTHPVPLVLGSGACLARPGDPYLRRDTALQKRQGVLCLHALDVRYCQREVLHMHTLSIWLWEVLCRRSRGIEG